MNVCIHYGSSRPEAESAVEEIRSLGVRCVAVQAELRRPVAAAQTVMEEANRQLGPIHCLINSAAIFRAGRLTDTSETDWDDHQNINLKAPFFLSQAFAKQLPHDGTGSIVNIIDWRAEHPITGHVAYTVAKSGLWSLTKMLAQELGPLIRVNGIAPGAILPAPGATSDEFEQRGKFNPLQKTGSPDDLAHALDYLLTAPFVTGEVLHVTGGEQLLTGCQSASH